MKLALLDGGSNVSLANSLFEKTVAVAGGTGPEAVTLTNCVANGAVKLALKDGADTLAMTSDVLDKSLVLLGGDGFETVLMDAVLVKGPATLKLGDGDNHVTIGRSSPATATTRSR